MEKSNSKPTKNKPLGTKETQVKTRTLGWAVLNYCRRLLKLVLLLRLFGEPECSSKNTSLHLLWIPNHLTHFPTIPQITTPPHPGLSFTLAASGLSLIIWFLL